MFAVIKTGGKQYRVAADDKLKVDKIKGEPGEIVTFQEVLVVGGENPVLGAPTVPGATVAAEVLEQGRGAKIIAFKKRRRKNSRRKRPLTFSVATYCRRECPEECSRYPATARNPGLPSFGHCILLQATPILKRSRGHCRLSRPMISVKHSGPATTIRGGTTIWATSLSFAHQ